MAGNRSSREKATSLRDRAEQTVRKRMGDLSRPSDAPAEDQARLAQELWIHQIELEMQNEALRQAQTDLEASRDAFFDLYDFAPIGYVTLSEKGLIDRANLTAATMLDVERTALLGQPFGRFVAADDKDDFYRFRREAADSQTPKTCRLRLTGPEKPPFPVSLTTSPRQAERTGLRITITDISELERLEQARADLEHQMEKRHRVDSLGALAAGMAHELNNLLLPITTLSEMVREDLPAESRNRVRLEKVVEAAKRAADLVRDVLRLSRTHEGTLGKARIDDVVLRAVEQLRPIIPATITIESSVPPISGGVVLNQDQMVSLIIAIVGNAIDAYEGHVGVVRVSLEDVEIEHEIADTLPPVAPGRYAVLTVADDGCGMDLETGEQALDPFFTTKEVGQGSGLGLAIVHAILDWHGGAIGFDSAPGKGTTVSVYLPVVP